MFSHNDLVITSDGIIGRFMTHRQERTCYFCNIWNLPTIYFNLKKYEDRYYLEGQDKLEWIESKIKIICELKPKVNH